MSRNLLLAGASVLAMLVAAGAADAETFTIPGKHSFTAPVMGQYSIDVLGANGGDSILAHLPGGFPGGLGAEVFGYTELVAGEVLTLYVGGRGATGLLGGGGGGASFVLDNTNPLAAAGGGGGAAFMQAGGPGEAGRNGGAGAGTDGGAGGTSAQGGGGGSFASGFNGGGGVGGAAIIAGSPSGYGGDGQAGDSGTGGTFPKGGNAGSLSGGAGGYGGGGGGGGGGAQAHTGGGGGGGGGYSGGGGGSGNKALPGAAYGGYAGGGGGSYLAGTFTGQILISGVHFGDGAITITLVTGAPAAPEPSTWAMTLAGFAGLGWLARTRKRKLTTV